jgi:hypothetical protein
MVNRFHDKFFVREEVESNVVCSFRQKLDAGAHLEASLWKSFINKVVY